MTMTTGSSANGGTGGRRQAFSSLRKAPSALFRSDKPPTDVNTATLGAAGVKKQRRKGLVSLLSRSKQEAQHPPPVPKLPATLHLPAHGTVQPENKQRPSCGPDPFGRPTREGARVVHHAFSPPRKQPSVHELARERRTNASAATSSASHGTPGAPNSPSPSLSGIHVVSIDDIDDLDDPLMEPNTPSPSRSPVVCWAELPPSSLPRRNASLGRSLNSPKLRAVAEDEEQAELASADTVQSAVLDRAKTRSRVWGVLSGKLRPKKAGSAKVSCAALAHSVPTKVAPQPKTPVFHVSQPSADNDLVTSISQHNKLVNDPDSPFISRAPVPKTSKFLDAMIEATEPSVSPEFKATARKSLPKRKSLVGLFGVAIQKSMDRLRAGVVAPAPLDVPATPPALAHALEDDVSLDTRAFNSRPGNTGFNAYGTLTCADAHIDDIASANEHLNKMVAHMDASPSMRKGVGFVSLTPSPLRRKRSGLLAPRRHSKAKLTTPKSKISSPSKRLTASFGKTLGIDYQNATPVKTTPVSVKSMVKGVRNMFAVSPGRLRPKTSQNFRPDSVATDMSDTDDLSVNDFEIEHDGDVVGGHGSALDGAESVGHEFTQSTQRPTLHHPFGSKPPTLALELDSPSRPSSLFHDMFAQYGAKLSTGSIASIGERNMARETFDFAQAIAALKGDAEVLADDDTLSVARTIDFSTDSPGKALSQLEEVLQSRKNSFETLGGNPSSSSQRRSNPPFQGGLAFQRHLAMARGPPGPPPPFALPPTPRQPTDSGHHKETSVASFASMSSLGAVLPNIDRGNARFIDQAFGFRPRTQNSITGLAFPERRHHRRASSGVSIDSVIFEEVSFVSSHSSIIGSHVTTGRADWAARRRASNDSVDSIARLGRPGLGDRMFDGRHESQQSLTSPTFGDRPRLFASTAAMKDESCEAPLDDSSRPISMLSDGGRINDLDGPSLPSEPEADIAAELSSESSSTKATTRRDRPAPLDLSPRHDTPDLTSPTSSATDTSSLFTVETIRLSNPPAPVHMRAAHGSITSMVQVQPTIHEETSQSTIHAPELQTNDDDARAAWALVHDLNARKWGDLGKLAQSLLDSPAERMNSNYVPRTSVEIETFLAESQANYKPLDEQPTGHSVHRRQTSIHSMRASTSPYSLMPMPLETRFKSKRGSAGRERPVSALLAEFAREVSPHPMFHTRVDDAGLNDRVRIRVPSDVRRDNLGWRRRRHSDDPLAQAPVVVAQKAVSAKPATATREAVPSFIAFPNTSSQEQPRNQDVCTTAQWQQPKPSTSQSSLKYRSSRPSSARSIKPAKPPVQKRFQVLVDQNGSPSSSRTTHGGVLVPRSDGVPLAPRHANMSKFPSLTKPKSSPNVRRAAKGDKENAAKPAHKPSARHSAVDTFV